MSVLVKKIEIDSLKPPLLVRSHVGGNEMVDDFAINGGLCGGGPVFVPASGRYRERQTVPPKKEKYDGKKIFNYFENFDT